MKFVHTETSRHGKTKYYFRRERSAARIRLPDDRQSPEFRTAYFFALKDDDALHLPPPPTFESRLQHRLERAMVKGLTSAKERAIKRGRPFDLTLEWALGQVEKQDFKCALTGIPFYAVAAERKLRNPFSPSLDRIDSNGGYTRDNVRIIVLALNVMLSDWGESLFAHVARAYRNNKNRTSIPAPKNPRPAPRKTIINIKELQ